MPRIVVTKDKTSGQWIARYDTREVGKGKTRAKALEGAVNALADEITVIKQQVLKLADRLGEMVVEVGEFEPPS